MITYYRDESGDIFTEDDLPDDDRPLWILGGNDDGDKDPINY